MLLYQQDYHTYPTAIIDTKTTNESFLHLASVYKKMGIQNWGFHLVLFQPELQGVDPFDEDLEVETIVKIIDECTYNPFYFFREIARVPPISGPDPVRFRANRGNIALIWCFLNHFDFLLIQPRQTGKSVSTDMLMTWLLFVASKNSRINMITLTDKLRAANIERLKKIRDLLPEYLYIPNKKDANNTEMITCVERSNVYSANVGQSSESGALNVARGTTAPIAHIDEAPFIKYIGVLIPAALAAGNQARTEARETNSPYGTIITTTSGKKDDRDGKYIYDMMIDGFVWNEVVFDCINQEDAIRFIKKNSTGSGVFINGTFSHRQLGKTDEWLYNAIVEAKAKGDEADRDFFNIWTSGTQRSPLSIKLNKVINESHREPNWVETSNDGYAINWYISKEELETRLRTSSFIMGQDTSDAIGKDGIGCVIIDITDMSVVGAGGYNETNLIMFGRWVAKVLIKYTNVTYIIERKSSGQAIIDCLLIELPKAGVDPFRRIFNHVVQDSDESKSKMEDYVAISRQNSNRNIEIYNAYKSKFGFVTTGSSRHDLFGNTLQEAAKRAGHLVHDVKLSTEIRGLVTKNGRIDHLASGNDDMVVSWLLAIWLLMNGKNLSFYGIKTDLVMSMVGSDNQVMNAVRLKEKEKQQRLRMQIEEVSEKLRNCSGGLQSTLLEQELRLLTRQTHLDGGEALNFDSLLKEAKESKKTKAMNMNQNSKITMPSWWN